MTPPPTALPTADCRNCGAALGSPLPKFCPACGQETRLRPPTLLEFAQQFGGAYLATEGALWRTLKLLLLKPGALTLEYLRGRRRHFVLPLRLYLTVSVLVLLLLRAVATVSLGPGAEKTPTPAAQRTFSFSMLGGDAGMREGHFFCHDLPPWVCQRLKRRLDVAPEAALREFQNFSDRFVANLGAAMFVLLPGFALALKLVFWRRRLHYTEHLVMALHLHAFWFLMVGLMLSGWAPLLVPALLAVPVYGLMALRRVYGGPWWLLVLQAGLVSVLHVTTLSVALAGVAGWVLLF